MFETALATIAIIEHVKRIAVNIIPASVNLKVCAEGNCDKLKFGDGSLEAIKYESTHNPSIMPTLINELLEPLPSVKNIGNTTADTILTTNKISAQLIIK